MIRLPQKTFLTFILMGAVFLAYWPSFSNGFIWDDDDYVTENTVLTKAGGLYDIWFTPGATPQYYPLVFTGFWVERRVFGLDPAGFHVVNAALHALGAVLLWRILALLAVPGAWLAAAVFALHPINVESVAWITERKNVLSGVFYFGAAFFFLWGSGLAGEGAFPAVQEGQSQPKGKKFYVASFLLFLCALLSKTVTSTFPAAMLIIVWWKRGKVRFIEILRLAPFFALAAVFGFVTVWMEKTHVGARGADFELDFFQRILLAGRALWFYAGKILWPQGFLFIYPRVVPPVSSPLAWLYPAGFIILAALLWVLRNRISRGPLAALLFFALTLFPALGFFNVYPFRFSFVADHFQYLAGPGIMALFAAALTLGIGRITQSFGPIAARSVTVAATMGIIVFLGLTSMFQTKIYANQETLWAATLARNPASWMAHNNLGAIRYGEGRLGDAKDHFSRVVVLKPDYAESLSNLATVYQREGDLKTAEALFKKALLIDPSLSSAHLNLADLYQKAGKPGLAGRHYTLAIAETGGLAAAYEKMAGMAIERGRADTGLTFYRWAVEADPSWTPARERLGTILASRGMNEEALPHLLAAYQSQPDMQGLAGNLGLVYLGLGRAEEALPVLEFAVSRKPSDPRLLDFLGLALALSGRPAEGAEKLKQALAIDPSYAAARQHLDQISGLDR